MILGECFEKFLERSPVSVMVRGTLERIFDPEKLERVFSSNSRKAVNPRKDAKNGGGFS